MNEGIADFQLPIADFKKALGKGKQLAIGNRQWEMN
jgi:hypothetical protein